MTVGSGIPMMRWVLPLVLMLSACSGGGGGGEGGQEAGPDVTSSLGSGDVTTSLGSGDSTTIAGPSVEFLAAMFPISGAELASLGISVQADSIESYKMLGECMSDEGFDFDFSWTVAPDNVPRAQHLPAYDSLKKYGFGVFLPDGFPPGVMYVEGLYDVRDGSEPLPEGVTLAEVDAILEAYNSCVAVESETVGEAAIAKELLLQEYFEFSDMFVNLLVEADATEPAVLDAFSEFHQCVTDRGYTLDLITDEGLPSTDDGAFFGAIDGALFAASDGGEGKSAVVALQREAAVDYADCMVPVEQVRQPIRKVIRDKFIDKHFAYIIEMEAAYWLDN